MRCYRIDPSGGIALGATETPRRIEPDEVRLRVRAVSLNFRDHLIAIGAYPLPVRAKLVPVSDGAGDVLEIGSAVTHVREGDRVMTAFFPDWRGGPIKPAVIERSLGGSLDGVLAEEVVLPASAVLPFPAYLSYEQAATLPCAGVTVWNATMEQGRLGAGDVVLLQGTGGVSSFALQFAKLAGATVIQTSSSEEKLSAAATRGADHLVNYVTTPSWDVEARRLTDGQGVDLVVEVGGATTLERSIRATRLGGCIVGVGLVGGLGKIDPLPLLTGVVCLAGILVGSHEMQRAMSDAMTKFDIEPMIGRTFAFGEAPAAFEQLAMGGEGKIVITL